MRILSPYIQMVPKPAGTAAHIPPERDERQGLNHAARPDRPIAFSGRTLCIFCGRGNRLGIGGKIVLAVQTPSASQTGNTEAMAEAVGAGIAKAGKEADVVEVSSASMEDLKAAKVFALGCPAMGAEVLEEMEMEPFVEEVEGFAQGKTIALFGSYGWGDGQWMRDWEERMTAAGATVLNGEGLICQETPDDDAIKQCEELGEQLAQNA